jgi:cytochrome c oxidase subunit 1
VTQTLVANPSTTVPAILPPLFETDVEREERETLERTWGRKTPRWWGWLISTNHKDIGVRFIVTAFVFFLLAGCLALAMRTQLAGPRLNVLGPDRYDQFFTTHGTTMMFLFAVPVMEGFAVYLVPLMIGARTIAFPRLTSFSYWTYLIAAGSLWVALALNFGPDMGWFAYTPLSGPEYGIGKRVDIWSQMVTLVEVASMSGAVSVITTIFKLRAPGMSLNRIPLFVWAMLIASFMIIFAMPAVSLCSTMLSTDRLANAGTHFFNQAEGGDALLWQHLFWFFGHPDVYIIFIPATGFVSAITATFCRRRIFGYLAMVLALVAVAFIGFGVWVHHMFVTPLPELGQGMFTAASLMIVVPNGIQIFCWLATMWGAKRIHVRTPMLWVFGFIATFVIGGLTGVMLASVQVDRQVHDTMFVVAHLHYVLIGGAIFPLFGAVYYWYPKFTGRLMSETLGKWNFWLMFIGFHMTFWPMHHLGVHGMPRRIYTYPFESGWAMMNHVASSGAAIQGIAVLLFLINVLRSNRRGEIAGPNPWGGETLEWAAASPPATYNFLYPPTAQGRSPMWDNGLDSPVVTGLDPTHRESLVTTTLDAAPDHRYDVHGDSPVPILFAIAVSMAVLWGSVFHPIGAVIGTALAGLALFAWFWSAGTRRRANAEPGK